MTYDTKVANASDTQSNGASQSAYILDTTMSVNDMVQLKPETLTVFAQYGLDTCCRGNMSIENAAVDASASLQDLERDLNQLIGATGGLVR